MSEEKKKRKERSDKKKAINPIISNDLNEWLCRLSYICNCSLKTVGEVLCEKAMNSKHIIEGLAPHFKRDYLWHQDSSSFFRGNPEILSDSKKVSQDTYRINLRFKKEIYEQIASIAFSLDKSKHATTCLLLENALHDKKVLGEFLVDMVIHELDDQRYNQLKFLLKKINYSNPLSPDITLGTLLTYFLDKMSNHTKRFSDTVCEWLDSKN